MIVQNDQLIKNKIVYCLLMLIHSAVINVNKKNY